MPLQNHRVPVQKTIGPNLKMLGPLCDQVDKGYSFVKQNKVLKNYASFNNGQKNSHRNHTNRISYKKHLQIDQLIFVSYKGRCHICLCILVDFYASRMQDAEVTKPLYLIFFIIIMVIVLVVHAKCHMRCASFNHQFNIHKSYL